LAFALGNPKFVRDRVRALFLVQGAFGGSGLADFVAGDGPELGREMPLRYRALGQIIGRAERKRLRRGKDGGLPGLTRKASKDFWEQTLDDHPDAIPIVSPKTFYVLGEAAPSRLGLFKRTTGWYLRAIAGPNDGVVAVDDQSLPDLGTVLAVLDAGHSDLTNRFPSALGARRLRRALVQGVMMAVGRVDEDDDEDENGDDDDVRRAVVEEEDGPSRPAARPGPDRPRPRRRIPKRR
jgi:hypothetical protein